MSFKNERRAKPRLCTHTKMCTHTKKRHTVVLIGDHAIIREGLRALLSEPPEVQVVGEFRNGVATVSQVAGLRPDLAVLDLSASGMNWVEVIAEIRKGSPETKIIVLSARQDEQYVISALRAGASAYILPDATKEEFLVALKSTLDGKNYLSSDLLSEILSFQVTGTKPVACHGLTDALTSREWQIMNLIAEGKTSRAIAVHLSISVKTVECHRTNLMKKLNLHNVAEVTAFVIKSGYSEEWSGR